MFGKINRVTAFSKWLFFNGYFIFWKLPNVKKVQRLLLHIKSGRVGKTSFCFAHRFNINGLLLFQEWWASGRMVCE